MQECVLCREPGGLVVWENPRCRVIVPGEPEHPGLTRVVLTRHATELSDLDRRDRHGILDVVHAVETALRSILRPDKINLASLGNLVPHLHWHVIPRWRDDPWFPAAIWAPPVRPQPARAFPADFAAALAQEMRVARG